MNGDTLMAVSSLLVAGVLAASSRREEPPAAPIVLYCASGGRSALAAESLGRMGYTEVYSLAGGLSAWTAGGGPRAGPP